MTARSPLADCCARCFPDALAAVTPSSVTAEPTGSLRASYACPVCGHEWVCWWDPKASGWPTYQSGTAA
jgi:hypothetical protein